jgi:glycerol-3-phosphate acyltransferase PlsY
MIVAILAILAFLIGSIPVGLLVARAKGIDITKVGSGNIGATNVVRALGPKVGLFVFVLDALKGALPTYVTSLFVTQQSYGLDTQTWRLLIGVVAILGHMFSPWLKFKGGKGVATGFGAAVGSIPLTALAALGVMIIVTVVSRYVSLASICAAISVLLFSNLVFHDSAQINPILIVMIAFIIWKHRGNIQRLREGTESKFSLKSKKEDDDDSAAR